MDADLQKCEGVGGIRKTDFTQKSQSTQSTQSSEARRRDFL
jgi:hypothetical protein